MMCSDYEPEESDTKPFTCLGCGVVIDPANPSMERSLSGAPGDPDTPHLCWVCKRLRNSALRDAGNCVGVEQPE